ncbi:hypothetical protein [Shinella sumterensis]|uniref:Uncharacterized protein n=1 Tax=Shinella sumterensis TaxID=1967501 RepID=A0AA50CQ92_9HYPH|nr:hypothetical protein [Shinella sumterensis]WLR98634.1 hypothetical protein Q9313_06280 [Shinella sumterensis]
MVTENTTPNRGYPEPAVGNTLEVDVGRLIAALRAIDVDVANALAAIVSKAGLASPVFTGTPTAPTAAPGTDSGQLATTAFVKAALTALVDSAPGALDTLNELAAAIGDDPNFAATMAALIGTKADAAATTAALAKRIRVDAAQSFTPAEKGRAIANLGGGVLAGLRNKLLNGDFDFWQRSTSQTSNGYGSDDRWSNEQAGSTKAHSRQAFTVGQSDVPGNPVFFSRTVVTSAIGSTSFVFKRQKIESVRTLAGRKATLTFYAKADASKNMAVEVLQRFGTGGSPSADVRADTRKLALTTAWQKFTYAIDIPPVAGKTLGSNGDDFLHIAFWFDAGSSFNASTDSLGQQSGTFDIAHVSFVEGDATAEEDPFAARHWQQELALCQRFYEKSYDLGVAPGTASSAVGSVCKSMDASQNFATLHMPFKVTKRSIPSVAVYNPATGASGQASVDAGSVSMSSSRIGQSSFLATVSNTLVTASVFIAAHFTAEAEL